MPVITALDEAPRQPQAIRVKIDHRPAATLSQRSVRELGLEVGLEVDVTLRNRIAEAAKVDRSLQSMMKLLARRTLSTQRAREKLAGTDLPSALQERVITRLQELGLLDDSAMARELIDEMHRRSPAAAPLLRHKMLQRGLSEATADEVLREKASDASPVELARQLVAQHLPRLRRLDEVTRLRRLAGLLARRGFEEDTIEQVLSEVEGSS